MLGILLGSCQCIPQSCGVYHSPTQSIGKTVESLYSSHTRLSVLLSGQGSFRSMLQSDQQRGNTDERRNRHDRPGIKMVNDNSSDQCACCNRAVIGGNVERRWRFGTVKVCGSLKHPRLHQQRQGRVGRPQTRSRAIASAWFVPAKLSAARLPISSTIVAKSVGR